MLKRIIRLVFDLGKGKRSTKAARRALQKTMKHPCFLAFSRISRYFVAPARGGRPARLRAALGLAVKLGET
jgi:hypothetical protein